MNKQFRSENMVLLAHTRWFGSLWTRVAVSVLSVIVYVTAFVLLVPVLRIAVNYFVIVPVIVWALAFGTLGGVIAGALGLWSNELLLLLRGYPQDMPENDIVALSAGVILGTTLGFLANHYRSLGREIVRRRQIDERLRFALKERTLLLREIHHRVKNNLNVIHSLIGLQIGGLKDASSVDLLNDLSRRIGSMAFVHDQLNEKPYTGALQLSGYLPSLVEHILGSQTTVDVSITSRIDEVLPEISLSRATSLGLIINEVVMNSVKHAFPVVKEPKLTTTVRSQGEYITIRITDNGPGFALETVKQGLGFGLIQALVRQLEGEYHFVTVAGTEFSLSMPVEDMKESPLW